MSRTAHYHKPVRIGYRMHVVKTHRGYKHLHMEVMQGFLCNAARDYELTGESHKLELAKNLREVTGCTEYLHTGCSEDKAELRWQSHLIGSEEYAARDNPDLIGTYSDWYALRIDEARFSPETLSMLGKIMRKVDHYSMYDASPQQVIEAIKVLKGFAVNYGQRCETWVGDWYMDGEGSVDLLDPNHGEQAVCATC